MEFRKLKAEEIELRIGTVTAKGVTMLCYKDARVDMNILDETVGAENWQCKYYEVVGNLYCSVGVRSGDLSGWVWKDDCGTESNTEKEKGQASDAFKRACFRFGIGRELYTSPFIFLPCKTKETQPGSKKYKMESAYEFSGAYVSKISYSKNVITAMEIKNKKGITIYNFGGNQQDEPKPIPKIAPSLIEELLVLADEASVKSADICARYGVESLEELSKSDGEKARKSLLKTLEKMPLKSVDLSEELSQNE